MKEFKIYFFPKIEIESANFTKLTGYTRVDSFFEILLNLDLETNPREPSKNSIAKNIKNTLDLRAELFPFMSKGILLTVYTIYPAEQNYVLLAKNDGYPAGIIDGGHNTLAIGLYILEKLSFPTKDVNNINSWNALKIYWIKHSEEIQLRLSRSNNQIFETLVPLEIISPSSHQGPEEFKNNIIIVSEARNSNIQIKNESILNQKGYFETLKENLPSQISHRIIWKTNGNGDIDIKYLISLFWVPLGVAFADKVSLPGNIAYSSKQEVIKRYTEIVDLIEKQGGAHANSLFLSSIEILTDILYAHDYIIMRFQDMVRSSKRGDLNRFFTNRIDKKNIFSDLELPRDLKMPPLGYIFPLIFGLREIIYVNNLGNLAWKEDPKSFLMKDENLLSIINVLIDTSMLVSGDPQKTGKLKITYESISSEIIRITRSKDRNQSINGLKRKHL